ncbi:MAG TPA: exodeoxyribonuclease VII large subunit [Kiritimatiellia bacterium]|nr:exodeoxyribonuclease VII large subunit [Kiritimatiellia bacterium]
MSKTIYTVSELNRRLKETLEQVFGEVVVEGEVSNLRRPSSGHLYFTLKDSGGQVAVVLFRGNQRMGPLPADGMKIRVTGELSVYVERGQYQIVARKVEEAGKGSLQEAFEKLKARLQAEGLFDADRKKPLPLLPRHIGIVTSSSGAAIRDILNVLDRRFPNLHIVLAPVRVQGEGAAAEIAEAINTLNRREDLDVLIVGRGGGSLEDLWAFNEEVVARAVATSRLPVISAVGHEIDFTICDFVADLRAPTPSAAAELVVQPKARLEQELTEMNRRLAGALQHLAQRYQNRFIRAARSYVFREPGHLLDRHRRRIEGWSKDMRSALRNRHQAVLQQLDEMEVRIGFRMRDALARQTRRLEQAQAQLRVLDPASVLNRGYSITKRDDGRVVTTPDAVAPGTELTTLVAGGILQSSVTSTHRKESRHAQETT